MVDLQLAKDEVMRKVGRNILLFQYLENALKVLVASGKISGYMSQSKSKQLKRSEGAAKQTLRAVANRFFEQNFSTESDKEQLPESLNEPYLTIRFKFDVENTNPESRANSLSELIDSRNELVHHFVNRIDSSSVDSWLEAGKFLDRQHKKIIPELDYFRSLAFSIKDLRRQAAESLKNELN